MPYTGTDHAQIPNGWCSLSLPQALYANRGTSPAKEFFRYVQIHEPHHMLKSRSCRSTCRAGEDLRINTNQLR
ncbi:hypothetical protein CBM2629_A20005 [Cupriavidus taiwanensis]|nr:hypothetical protein CBM2629_A20005 [Cupriavidus taiwanensis]